MPLTAACGIVGALAISSFPLTSGFISKSMISQAAADEHLFYVWLGLAAASAGVFLHAGIKFPWFVFFQKDSGLRPPDPPLNMRIAMVLFAALCILIGILPGPLYALLPFPVHYVPYTGAHVVTQLQLLLFSGLAFFVMLGYLRRTLTITLDVDWIYRRILPGIAHGFFAALKYVRDCLGVRLHAAGRGLAARVNGSYGPEGLLARTWPTGSMALWMMVLLLGYLVLYYA
jgi:multicomponent Na+:H+ antiporter subunit D